MTTDELRRLLEAATPGPWVSGLFGEYLDGAWAESRVHKDGETVAYAVSVDADLIAAAVNALPALLAVAEAALEVRSATVANDAVRRMKGSEIRAIVGEDHEAIWAYLEAPRIRLEQAKAKYDAALARLEAPDAQP